MLPRIAADNTSHQRITNNQGSEKPGFYFKKAQPGGFWIFWMRNASSCQINIERKDEFNRRLTVDFLKEQ